MFIDLRTSETNYLNEAFSFYSAIRARSYYSRIAKEDQHGGSKSVLIKHFIAPLIKNPN